MKKMTLLIVIMLIPVLFILGSGQEEQTDWQGISFEDAVVAAEGTEVSFFMWGGDAKINDWIDTFVADSVKELYGIRLKRVPMDASVFVNKLYTEKIAGKEQGTIDLVWINGENFKRAKQEGLLYGPYSEKLPSYDFVDPQRVAFDFGFPVEGYEAPYGTAQFVFEYDSAKTGNIPETFDELFKWVKANPGRFTYPQPPDFTGSAFIRQVFYATTGGYGQYLEKFDEALYREKSPMMWDYLNALKPYLWQNGRTYPMEKAALDTLFERGEVDINMSYHQALAQSRIIDGRYPDTVKTFVMKDGSIANIHYTAIPFNAPNIPGGMVVSNFLLSAEAQYSKNLPENWGDFTVLDPSRLPEEDRSKFASIDLGSATLPLEILSEYAVPEISPEYLELIEEDWEEYVLREQ
jgi:putative spermidine/putrescine transport system substrate-binding protein